MIYRTAPFSATLNDSYHYFKVTPNKLHHYLMLTISETARDTDMISMKY